jgi:hypothetical protein
LYESCVVNLPGLDYETHCILDKLLQIRRLRNIIYGNPLTNIRLQTSKGATAKSHTDVIVHYISIRTVDIKMTEI